MQVFPPYKHTILLLSESQTPLDAVFASLNEAYDVRRTGGHEFAADIHEESQPDLVLLDVENPGFAGHDLCRQLKQLALPRELPIIFLTHGSAMENEALSIELDVVDHLTLPLNSKILQSRVRAHFAISDRASAMRMHNEYLEIDILKRKRQLAVMQDTTILALASLAETRDVDTANHIRRTQHYVLALANHLRNNPRFTDYLTAATIDILFKCAPLHDIGKVGIPDKILLKPGRYEPAEFEIMKRHPVLGRDAILNAQKAAGETLDFFEIAKDVVYSHHEKWDGSGYPVGLVGDAIPIAGRLMALADVYDALISPRVYKSGMPHDQAANIIVSGNGLHFDPDVVEAFIELAPEFIDIAQQFADSDLDLNQKADFLSSAL
jgi:putative two-component system response regulator